jgi:hypothetical protein
MVFFTSVLLSVCFRMIPCLQVNHTVGTPPRDTISVATVSRQVSYQTAHDSFTPSNTVVCSPPVTFSMSNSARSILPQRQVSFSPEVHGMDNPSSTNDVSLTEALQSLATVNQAVVQTLRELKPGKSSSSNSRFRVDKIFLIRVNVS